MEVYRIAHTRHIRDLTGTGARLYGGRWNSKGTGIVYTSETRALAVLEYLVHVPLSMVPSALSMASIRIPDNLYAKHISLFLSALPKSWRAYPAPSQLAELGTNWIGKNDTLLLRVPSVVVEHEFNLLINPSHPDMKQVTISAVADFKIDDRLIRPK
ncbi:MAG TPA: RES family NAD+ phosphorylase [Nitrospirota bacterium]|nr:RES family NAD+ phosphorylase [Nitrospirota bacterium]